MTEVKKYVFDYINVRIPISAMTIRRNLDTTAFCSVTVPDPEQVVEILPGITQTLDKFIEANPDGNMIISQTIGSGSEVTVGTYVLSQVLSSRSPSAFTLVLNGTALFGVDQTSSGSYIIPNPITNNNDTTGLQRFSAEENALIVIGDTITLEGSDVIARTISLFVNAVNSRMDVAVTGVII